MCDGSNICRYSIVVLLCAFAGMATAAGTGKALTDPTRPANWHARSDVPLTADADPVGGLILQGVFSAPGQRSAMINGQRVAVGDMVSGATVLLIEKNKVTLSLDGESIELAAMLPTVKSAVHERGER